MSRSASSPVAVGKPIRLAAGVLAAEAYGIRSTAGDVTRFVAANMSLVGSNGTLRRAIIATHTAYFRAGVLTQDLIWEQYRYPVTLKALIAGNSAKMLFDAVPARKIEPPRPTTSSPPWRPNPGRHRGGGTGAALPAWTGNRGGEVRVPAGSRGERLVTRGLGLVGPVIMGHSMGGMTAGRLSAIH